MVVRNNTIWCFRRWKKCWNLVNIKSDSLKGQVSLCSWVKSIDYKTYEGPLDFSIFMTKLSSQVVGLSPKLFFKGVGRDSAGVITEVGEGKFCGRWWVWNNDQWPGCRHQGLWPQKFVNESEIVVTRYDWYESCYYYGGSLLVGGAFRKVS